MKATQQKEKSAQDLVTALAVRGVHIDLDMAKEVLFEVSMPKAKEAPELTFLRTAMFCISRFTQDHDQVGTDELPYQLNEAPDGSYELDLLAMKGCAAETIRHADPVALGVAYATRLSQSLAEDPVELIDYARTTDVSVDSAGHVIIVDVDDDDEEGEGNDCPHCSAIAAYNVYASENELDFVEDLALVRPAGHLVFFKVEASDRDVLVLHTCDGSVSKALAHDSLFLEGAESEEIIGTKVVIADSLAPEVVTDYNGMPCEGVVTHAYESEEHGYTVRVKTLMGSHEVPLDSAIPVKSNGKPAVAKHLH